MSDAEIRDGEVPMAQDPALLPGDAHVVFIGRVRSPWVGRADCPKNMAAARETGQAALVVDHYDEDWTQLAWVLVRGQATIQTVPPDILVMLREKYPQYQSMHLEGADAIRVEIDRWSSWRSNLS